MEIAQDGLPKGWIWTTIGNVISDIQPGFASGKKNVHDGINHLRMNNITSLCTLDLADVKKVPSNLGRENYLLLPKDILICHTNSKKLVGKTALFDVKDGKYAFSNHLTRIRVFKEGPWPEWIWFTLTTLWRKRYFETRCKQWVNQATIDKENILSAPIPLAPMKEQERIIRKVHELRTKVYELKKIVEIIRPSLLNIRPSILHKAFSGGLTKHIEVDSSPSVILEEILANRKNLKNKNEKKFTEELNNYIKMVTIGKPKNWVWAPMGLLFDIEMGLSPPGSSYNDQGDGIPLLNGPTEFGINHPTPKQWTTSPTRVCKKNDLLICVRGSTTGRLNWADQSYCIGRGLAAIRPLSQKLNVYLLYYFLMLRITELIKPGQTTGSTFPNLQKERLSEFMFPLSSEREQNQIVELVDRYFVYLDQIQEQIDQCQGLLSTIDDSILENALRGQLVDQDSRVENASLLLNLIIPNSVSGRIKNSKRR